jgi:ATP-dependent Clp protease ATP-binding subunit ClpX
MVAILNDAMYEIQSQENLKDFKVVLTYAKTKFERTVFHQIDHVA